MKRLPRVAFTFATYDKDQMNSCLIVLLICLKTNPLFPNLPIAYAALTAMVTDYQQKMAAAAVGGQKDKAAFDEAWDQVIITLRQIAGYIQSLGLTNESDVLSSGFDIVSTNKKSPTSLDTPDVTLDNSVTGQIGVSFAAVAYGKVYQVQYYAGTSGTFVDLGFFTGTRDIAIPSTVAGTVYSVRVRVFGGSSLTSSWSGVISLMST